MLPSGSTLTPSGCWSSAWAAAPSRKPKSNRPVPTAVWTAKASPSASTQRSDEVSLSASHSRSPSGASPEVCANHASATGPSSRPSLVVPAATATAPVRGSRVHSWWMPAIATQTRSRHQATSQGLESRVVPSPSNHWTPSPASTRTSPVASVMPRSWWWTVSATTTSYPTSAATSAGSRHRPFGSRKPPRPAHDVAVRRTARPTSSCPASATRRRRRAAAPPSRGSAGRSAPTGGATYGESPGCSVPRARCCSTRLVEQGLDRVDVPLAGVLRDDVALRVDEHQRRPGPGGVGLPGDELGVVEDGVLHGVPLDGLGERHRVGLVHELRRVHADDDQLLGEPLLQRPQLVDDVQAVDAAEGPEVEQHEAAAQVAQGDGAVGVQPGPAASSGARTRGRVLMPPSSPASTRRLLTAQGVDPSPVDGPGRRPVAC